MTRPADHEARTRFADELERNFSVVASAGSGKTRAITDRIVTLAKSPAALERLPELVVVTYTNRAADEMQQRTRQRILEEGLSLATVEAFGRAFFGTIHSFCVKLLRAHGHHLGLPAELELVTDDDDLWEEFVQQHTRVGHSLGEARRRDLLRYVHVRHIMDLARKLASDLAAAAPAESCPEVNFDAVLQVVPKGTSVRTIERDLDNLRRWDERRRNTPEFVPWPPRTCNAKEFVKTWRTAFAPLRAWTNACTLSVAAEVQRAYRDFRYQRGIVNYADQVALAAALMRRPEIVRRIREKNYRVILDEAQDTDPEQFLVLLEITRPLEAAGLWLETGDAPPSPGHFCMVGDFQQSIYRPLADLKRYRALHEKLTAQGAADALTFSVTFRLDQAQVQFVNDAFPHLFNNELGQVEFVRLNPRPDALPGQIVRFCLTNDSDEKKTELQLAALEARELATWIRDQGLEKLRAASWREVAILAPRRAWLRTMRDALQTLNLPAEVQSESELRAENPAYAWLTALLAIMVDPHDGYEITGVLREVFGLSDNELARFAQGHGARLQIAARTRERGLVANTLNSLESLHRAIAQQPLFSAVQEIVRMTQLRERLCSLPRETYPDLAADLDRLLSEAAATEANGLSLSDFATHLRANYSVVRETNPSSVDAIQLITAHKAKGSEWQAVVIPFLSREVRVTSLRYPRLLHMPDGSPPQIVVEKAEADDYKEELDLALRQEMERLLYVALTRAKHTLVLAYDRELFAKKGDKLHAKSQLNWLHADHGQPNEQRINNLPDELRASSDTKARQESSDTFVTNEKLTQHEIGWLDQARKKAASFIHTVVPSKLQTEEETLTESDDDWLEVEPELRPARVDNPATRYGLWWHSLAQGIRWLQVADTWDETFDLHYPNSPDTTRATREWRLLRANLRGLTDLVPAWKNPTLQVRAEMPFYWKMSDRRSLEGVIDLALFDPTNKEWLLIDWKTNQITESKLPDLRQSYRAQLAAYRHALQQMTGANVRAALYSTATGQVIHYQAQELDQEWLRLEKLSRDDLHGELGEP